MASLALSGISDRDSIVRGALVQVRLDAKGPIDNSVRKQVQLRRRAHSIRIVRGMLYSTLRRNMRVNAVVDLLSLQAFGLTLVLFLYRIQSFTM